MAEPDLRAIERRLVAASGTSWDFAVVEHEEPVVRVLFAGGDTTDMRVTRENRPASVDDVRFIACARSDLERLVGHLSGSGVVCEGELDAIERGAGEQVQALRECSWSGTGVTAAMT